MAVINFLIENWQLLIIAIVVVAVAIYIVYAFVKMPRSAQIAKFQEWLLWAVAEAEKSLGSGTGQLKLRYVYDMAIKQFPWIVTLVTFEVFGGWVDEALDWMRDQLKQNSAIEGYTMNRE